MKVVQIQFFQPALVILWPVFWNTKIANIYKRLPKAKANPEEAVLLEKVFAEKLFPFSQNRSLDVSQSDRK